MTMDIHWEMTRRRLLALSAVLAGAAACGEDTASTPPETSSRLPQGSPPPLPLGNRVVGISATNREDDAFDQIIELVEQAGCQTVSLSLYWDEIETAPKVYEPEPNWPAIANQFYSDKDLRLTISLAGIDTNNDRRPADLIGLPYNHPSVVERYIAVANFVLETLSDVTIECFSVCNEIDATLGADVAAWGFFRSFFESVAPALRHARPGMVVGAKATSAVITEEPAASEYALMMEHADAWMLTYYPLDADFMVRQPDAPENDFARIATLPGTLPVRLLEIGYPSDPSTGGSEALQADFVAHMFKAWDSHRGRIAQIDYFAMHDFSPAIVEALQSYYSLSNPAFGGFLGSLGLRRWSGNGQAKAAWNEFTAQVVARG